MIIMREVQIHKQPSVATSSINWNMFEFFIVVSFFEEIVSMETIFIFWATELVVNYLSVSFLKETVSMETNFTILETKLVKIVYSVSF